MAIQIFILCRLIEGNNYPYKLKKQLSETIPLARLGGLTESKLYYNFESLVKQGLIEPVEIIKEEHRPDKQVFAITTKGREALPKKIYKLFESAQVISEMVVGLVYINYVDRDKVVAILEKKLSNFKERWGQIAKLALLTPVDHEKEKILDFVGEYASSRSDHTIHWLEQLIKLLQQREI
ncbi:MAG: PadR family transcriptional regulator [Candidatus Pristimantibacillus lignocellulolyticus]|uniref:PadR family transcriptional regulator n=1 Tax=Candidatus Pristimantibacillus lignocellulolyticus TaxID=2994561 RepID=A0A9J6ZJB8_9BACL|nr:MAG: PadR family transcriptional regulator [Candidatus Pristimantibacillus lignocellulolyticus]